MIALVTFALIVVAVAVAFCLLKGLNKQEIHTVGEAHTVTIQTDQVISTSSCSLRSPPYK